MTGIYLVLTVCHHFLTLPVTIECVEGDAMEPPFYSDDDCRQRGERLIDMGQAVDYHCEERSLDR